jgi:dihydropyrimidinase
MDFDLIVSGGTVVTEAGPIPADIGVKDGTIARIAPGLSGAARVVDATGRFVLPGGIDSHVHLSQPSGEGVVMADDFASGTRSALHGGTTTVMPFCLPEKGRSLREALADYHAQAEGRLHTDASFHLILNDPTEAQLGQELPALIAGGYTSIKVFMTYEGLRLRDDQILSAMDVARAAGAVVMVHAENEDVIRHLADRAERAGDLVPAAHARTRPVAAEREATHRALSLAQVTEAPVVIVHVSNGEAIEEIARARARGVNVTAETCPQYLVLTARDLEAMDWSGAKFVCSPPPRDEAHQAAVWQGIETGVFDLFSSDHCPFVYDSPTGKLTPRGRTSFRHVPNGIPGVETRLAILWTLGVATGRIDVARFAALTATNHARTYGLYPRKGAIAVGSDADLAIWDPEARRTIRHADLHDACDYTPYEGFEAQGWPVTVILRGQVAIEEGKATGGPSGIYLYDRAPRPVSQSAPA